MKNLKFQLQTYMITSFQIFTLGPLNNPRLKKTFKNKISPHYLSIKFHKIQEYYPNHNYIFTDGAKDNDKTECAVVFYKTIARKCISKDTSIFSGETCTRDLAPFHRATLKELLSSQTHFRFDYS